MNTYAFLTAISAAEIAASNRRGSLIDYVAASFDGYVVGEFHRRVCAELEAFSKAVREQKSPRLILTAPPRHGKSFMISERFPCWHLGHNPDHEIISTAYGLTAARDRAKAARDVAQSEMHALTFPNFAISRDTSAKTDWALANGRGSLKAVGVGGGIVGKGAHILIIDDPVKSAAEAASATKRDHTWEWYKSDASSRLPKGGGILIMATRYHEDDLIGRVLDKHKHQNWRVLNFPAIAECDDDFRKAGDALCPELFDLEFLRLKEMDDPRIFSTQFQQRPSSANGAIWLNKWWRFYEVPPARGADFQSWDLTFSDTGNSFVVGQVWRRWKGDLYLLKQYRFRGGFVATLDAIRKAMKEYPKTQKILIENKANGPGVINYLEKEKWGNRIIPINPKGSKVVRAKACEPVIRAGRILLPNPDHNLWVKDFLKECAEFPNCANDDQVDCTSQTINWSEANISKKYSNTPRVLPVDLARK